jgi:hypothetical protein
LILSVGFAYKTGTDNGKQQYKNELEESGVINLPDINEELVNQEEGLELTESDSNTTDVKEKVVEKIVYRDNIGVIQKVTTPLYISDQGANGYAPQDLRLEYLVPSYYNVYSFEGYGLVGGGIVDFQSASHGTHLYLSSNPIVSTSCDGVEANKCLNVDNVSDIYLTFNYMPGIPAWDYTNDTENLDSNIKPKVNNLVCHKENDKYSCRGYVKYSEGKSTWMFVYLNNNVVYEDYKRFVESLEIK